MLLARSDTALTRDELARTLSLPRPLVDALIGGSSQADRIPLRDVERALQTALLRVYHAEVESGRAEPKAEPEESITIEGTQRPAPQAQVEAQANDEAEPVVTHSIAEFEAEANRADLRLAPRYIPRRQIGGVFQKVRFSILQISSTGLRIRHDSTLLPGEVGRLSFALVQPAQSFPMTARVIWTSIAQRGEGPTFCISGLRVVDNGERLRRAVEMLRQKGELEVERPTGRRKSGESAPPALRGMADEEVASILRAVRRLANDPVEASRWYARARYAIADEQVRQAIQHHTRDREQVLGVWEYLERKVDLQKVAGVVAWMRNTRAAAD
jgi:hypothetical protein